MPITQTGPQGYEFQYLATCLIGLENIQRTGLRLLVEHGGGEDAEMSFSAAYGTQTVEIQAKSSQEDIGLGELAEFLTHFIPRSAEQNLLSRILGESSRLALFILGGRCNDALRGFLSPLGSVAPHTTDPINRDELSDLLEKVANCFDVSKPTELDAKRLSFCRRQKEAVVGDAVRSVVQALRRVLIWEQVNYARLDAHVREYLTRRFLIPPLVAPQVLLELLAAVRNARDNHSDAIPLFTTIVNRFAGTRFLNEAHVSRGVDFDLEQELRTRRVLLFSGSSKCGKTHTARFLAQQLQNDGVAGEIGDDVGAASRYLNSIGTDERLYILDDPFGSLQLNTDAAEALSRLRDLISSLPPNRFLIVTSRSELLPMLGGSESIAGSKWRDLTVRDAAFLLEFWNSTCENQGLSLAAFNTVRNHLTTQPAGELLQPGQLRYLSFITDDVGAWDFAALARVARFNSTDLANVWRSRGPVCERLHCALALGASTVEGISLTSLGFLLSDASESPGLVEAELGVLLFGPDQPAPTFPQYQSEPTLSAEYTRELSYLLQRGQIRKLGEQLAYSHPDYYEASFQVVIGLGELRFQEVLNIATRGVSCLDPKTVKSLVRSQRRLYVQAESPQKTKIIEIAFLATSSIFPAARDMAQANLVAWLPALSKSLQTRVLQMVSNTAINSRPLLWHDDTPWLNPRGVDPVDWLELRTCNLTAESADILVQRLLSKSQEAPLTVREAWELVKFFKEHSQGESSRVVLRALMNFEEVFIRAEAAFLLISNLNEVDQPSIDLAFQDQHPSVTMHAILGCFAGWRSFSSSLRDVLRSVLGQEFKALAIVARANGYIMDFGDPYSHMELRWDTLDETCQRDLWTLWAEIVPVFLRTLSSHSIAIDHGHLWNTTRESCKWLSPPLGMAVCEAWLTWIEARLEESLLDDYALALPEYLIKVTSPQPDLRSSISEQLLGHKDTSFLLSNLRDYLRSWTQLTEVERKTVLGLCSSSRTDAIWIRAVALTRDGVPSEIVQRITGKESLKNVHPAALLNDLGPELLRACLEVYTGRHPLDYLSLAFSCHEPWHDVLEFLVKDPSSSNFELALDQMLQWALNGEMRWHRAPRLWANLCTAAPTELHETLFSVLLKWTIRISGARCGVYWRVFFNQVNNKTLYARFLEEISTHIEGIERACENLVGAFGQYRFSHEIAPKLRSDILVLRSIHDARRFERALTRTTLQLIEAIYDSEPPRLRRTHDRVLSWLNQETVAADHAIYRRVEDARKQTIARGEAQLDKYNEYSTLDLPGWVRLLKSVEHGS